MQKAGALHTCFCIASFILCLTGKLYLFLQDSQGKSGLCQNKLASGFKAKPGLKPRDTQAPWILCTGTENFLLKLGPAIIFNVRKKNMWFWLSLIAILFWSGSDLFSKIGSKPDDKYSHWKMVIAVGLIMGIHAGIELLQGVPFKIEDLILYLPVSLLYISAMVLGYAGLRYVTLSVSTPVCNSSGAVAALLCFFFLNQRMSWLQLTAVALITAGIFALSFFEKEQDDAKRLQEGDVPEKKYTNSLIAILFPILYCLIDGLGTFGDALVLNQYIQEGIANIAYELTFLFLAVLSYLYLVVVRKQKIRLSKEKPKIVAGLCETAGQFAYIYALGDNAIVAAPLISSYCIFSVLWARLILKEKLTVKQYAAIFIAVIGIVILGAG